MEQQMTPEANVDPARPTEKPVEPHMLFQNAVDALSKACPSDAAHFLEKAIFIRPGQPIYHLKLGEAYQALRRFDEAAAAFRMAIRLKPELWQAHVGLGRSLGAQGNEIEATPHLRRGAKLMAAERKKAFFISLQLLRHKLRNLVLGRYGKASASSAQLRVGKSLDARGDLDTAIARYRTAITISPDSVQALTALGNAYRKAHVFGEAVKTLRHAELLAPEDPEVLAPLGLALVQHGDPATGQVLIQSALADKPDWAAAHEALGWALQYQGDSLGAMAEFERSLRLAPESKSVNARIGLAYCLEDAGQIDAASDHWDRIVSAMPCNGIARFRVAQRKKCNDDDPELAAVERCMARENLSTLDRRYLNFAAGKMYDDIGDVDRAFDCYDLANKLEDVAFDPSLCSRNFSELIEVFRAELFERLEEFGSASMLPVFVVGMPRSGTSLTEQILSSHPAVFGAGELPHIQTLTRTLQDDLHADQPYPICVNQINKTTIRNSYNWYIDLLRRQSGEAVRVIDKMPGNFQNLGLIQLLFPHARVIHCIRDPLDTCLSIYFTPFSEVHPYRSCLAHLGLYYREYRRLMEHWRRELRMPLFEVRYEDLVNTQEEVSRQLLEFCGLEWDDRCLSFHKADRLVHTASNLQVRKPIYKTSLARHQRYAKHLLPLRQILEASETS